jgi:hypothetical protein
MFFPVGVFIKSRWEASESKEDNFQKSLEVSLPHYAETVK